MSSVAASSSISGPIAVGAWRRPLLAQTSFAALISAGIALYFWVDSRYPALLKKMHSGSAIRTKGVLSFDALMPVTPAMSLMTRIGHTAVNWMWTNRIGMPFGICFGAAVLTLLSTLPRVRLKSAAANTLLGAIGGVPLGVCANCVAPIGRSLFVAGASPSTVLATMISSPTLNVIVLAMAFTLFPLPIALARLAVPLILLALVPLIVRKAAPAATSYCTVPKQSGWCQPVGFTINSYLKNLGRLALSTVPLMVLAAFLGAVVAELCANGVRRRRSFSAHEKWSSAALCGHSLVHSGRVQRLLCADSGTHDFMANVCSAVCRGDVVGCPSRLLDRDCAACFLKIGGLRCRADSRFVRIAIAVLSLR